jgi:hypothetical protein
MTFLHASVIPGLDPMGAKIAGSGPLFVVMAARVAAIHVFGAASKVVDGRARPGHDGQKVGCPDPILAPMGLDPGINRGTVLVRSTGRARG